MDAIERRKRASAEAADWFVRLQARDLPRSSREQYIDWLRDSPTHVGEMLRIAQVHGSLEQFQRWADLSTGPSDEAKIIPIGSMKPFPPEARGGYGKARSEDLEATPVQRENESKRSSRKLRLFTLAATLAAVWIGTVVLLPKTPGQLIDTERGERREVVLSDGSVVQVDPQTHLRVKFEDHVRRVYLERGRALFHVAKNPDRPFLVQAEDTTIRAVGTAFGVDRQGAGIIVTVSEGEVAVLAPAATKRGVRLSDEGSKGAAQRAGEASREVLVTAGQQLTVQRSGAAVPVRKVDTTRELAWADGRLIFENDRVTHVIGEFNRYNRVQLHVTDPVLAARLVSGVFSTSDPESFIAFIQTVAPVRIDRGADGEVTLSAGDPQ